LAWRGGRKEARALIANSRRTFVATLMGLGVIAGTRSGLAPLHAAPTGPLRLPEMGLRLERMVTHEFGAGGMIRVRRSWDVFFGQQGRGAVVTGRQTAAEVTAPPNLASFAAIEQRRDTSAMFPLLLGEGGMILTSGGDAPADTAVASAMRTAEAMIARQPVPEDQRDSYRFYLAQVHAAGSNLLDTLPPDLFFPIGMPVDRSEVVTLPNGLHGRFALTYSARPQVDAPWLAQAERRVQSEVGGFTRSASEVWNLGLS
jgi:hypothetical protein